MHETSNDNEVRKIGQDPLARVSTRLGKEKVDHARPSPTSLMILVTSSVLKGFVVISDFVISFYGSNQNIVCQYGFIPLAYDDDVPSSLRFLPASSSLSYFNLGLGINLDLDVGHFELISLELGVRR